MNWDKTYSEIMHDLKTGLTEFPWENQENYARWLAQTYYFVNNSTRMLALASAKTSHSRSQLHNRFIDHAKEERGHELLLIRDLKGLGRKIEEFPEFYSTAGLYKSQYYWIEHQSPAAFLGWIVVLESIAAIYGPDILKRVESSHGSKCSNFWRVHACEDQDHIKKAIAEVRNAPSEDQKLIIQNFDHSGRFYLEMLSECQATSNSQRLVA